VTRVIRPELPPLFEKNHEVQFLINQILKDKIKKKLSKRIKKYISIKRIKIKIQIPNKFYIWLKGKIEKKY